MMNWSWETLSAKKSSQIWSGFKIKKRICFKRETHTFLFTSCYPEKLITLFIQKKNYLQEATTYEALD